MAVNNLSINSSGYSVIKFGQATINAGNTYVDVSVSMPSSNYIVVITPLGVLSSPYISNKTTSGFRINVSSAPGSNTSVGWIAIE